MRRLLSLLLLLGVGVGGACSAHAPEAAKSPPAAEPQPGGASPADAAAEAAPPAAPLATTSLEQTDPAAALADAEARLERALAPGPRPGERPRSEGKKAEEPQSRQGDARGDGGDPCAVACRALASMRRSATRLCELAGESGPDAPRCEDARARVARAATRMQERCPACAGDD